MRPREPAKVEIHCPACGRDAWLTRKAQYDGFTKVGEIVACALCGHLFDSEADIRTKTAARRRFLPRRTAPPGSDFNEDEKGKMCRYCAEYVVNPFVQRCALHQREVEATDTCPHFRPKPPPEEETDGLSLGPL